MHISSLIYYWRAILQNRSNHSFWDKSFLLSAVALATLTGGCSLVEKVTGPKTDYQITRNEADQKSSDYLRKILDERVKEKAKTFSDDADTRIRQEDTLEKTLRADLLKALYAKGYYSAAVSFQKGTDPLSGKFDIAYGPRYTISGLNVKPEGYAVDLNPRAKTLPGAPLDAERVLRAQDGLNRNISKEGCYFSLSVKNEVYLDRTKHEGDVNFIVDAGDQAKFGPLAFKGNDDVKASYLRKLVPWKEGDCFRRDKIEEYKTALLQSGLFARADISLPDGPAADGTVPMTMELRERAPRSIGAGLTYYSDEGPGAVFNWEHRNLFGAAEKLRADLTISAIKQGIDLDFNKPYFLRKDQSLSLTSSLRRQDTDAFVESGLDAGIALNRNLTEHLTGSTGIKLTLSNIDDKTDETKKTYGLVSFPQSLTYDTRDDKLDPHKGWNLSGSGAPYYDVLGESDPFFKFQASGSGYLSLGTKADLVLASKVGVGSIWGATLEDIPATERFYAGGGGSIRGFGYQEVGPQKDGDPTGGLSTANFSFELRSKFTKTIGGVAFVDGASVTEDSAPTLQNMAIGAGVGIRYYTSFGPIRFDIATPLTQKENLDQNYQFYISIGQAF